MTFSAMDMKYMVYSFRLERDLVSQSVDRYDEKEIKGQLNETDGVKTTMIKIKRDLYI